MGRTMQMHATRTMTRYTMMYLSKRRDCSASSPQCSEMSGSDMANQILIQLTRPVVWMDCCRPMSPNMRLESASACSASAAAEWSMASKSAGAE